MEEKRSGFSAMWQTKPMAVIHAEENSQDIPRTLTMFDLCCIGIGGTIGSGIFSTAGSIIAETAGPAAVVSWLVGGVVCCLNSLAYMELVTRVPSSGSTYAYAYHTIGELPAVVAAWLLTLEYAVSGAGVARSWGDKVEEWLLLEYPDKDFSWLNLQSANLSGGLIQFLSMVVLLMGVRFGKAFVNTVTIIKMCVVVFIIVAGFAALNPDNLSPFVPTRTELDGTMAFGTQGIITGASQAFFGYVGFDEICCLAGETKNPKKILPTAVMVVVVGTMVLSALCSLVLAGMVNYLDASSFGNGFEGHGWSWAGTIVRAGEVVTMPVVALIGFLAQPRLNYALACDGLLPRVFAEVDSKGNLFKNTLITGIFFTIIAIVVPFDTLWDIVNFGVMMSFIIANVSLVLARMKSKSPKLAPILIATLVVTSGCTAFLYQEGYENESSTACLILAIICLIATVGIAVVLFVKCPQVANAPGLFAAPLVPFIPMICILADWYMIAQIGHLALGLSVAWMGAGVVSYFAYGYWNAEARSGWSTLLGQNLPTHEDSLAAPMLSAKGQTKYSVQDLKSPAIEYQQSHIYMTLALLYVASLGEILLNSHSHFLGFKINIKIVGSLRTLVFENTISQPDHIPGHAAGSNDREGDKKRMAEVAHLYAHDVAHVARMVTHMQFVWRCVLQSAFELFILVQVIGIKFKPIAIAFIILAIFVRFLSAVGNRLRRELQKKVEARLNVIHECFKGIQMVKLNAWEDKMQEKIDRARDDENRERRSVNLVSALQYCLGVDSPNLASVFIFGWVALQDSSALSPARVFPALLLLRRIRQHFHSIVRLFDVVTKGQASFYKIDDYLDKCRARSCAQTQTDKTRNLQPSSSGSNAPDIVVSMEHACFGQSTEEGKALLVNVSFQVRRGQLAMIQGKAGAGKTTLLNALLNDIKCVDGKVLITGDCRVAYCAQEPWLQTLSIRENILFGSSFDYKKYWCIVEACCLTDDLQMLPEGDNTQVGPKGINLSGGQKSRIALARACYADADVYLLDCPFASVDAIVQNEIFTKCIVQLLRFKTVFMVTHNPELSSSSFVDHVIRVGGLTVEVESAEKGWDIGRHLSRRVDTRNSLPPWRHEDESVNQKSGPNPRCLALWEPATPPLSSSAMLIKSAAFKQAAIVENTQVPVTSECVGRKMARKFKWKEEWFSVKTWKVLLKGNKCIRYHVPAKLFLVLYTVAVTSKDLFLMGWSDRVDRGDVSSMEQSARIYGVLVISSIISGFASSVLHAHAMSNSANRMFHDMTAALLRAPMTFFYSTPVGELFNRYFNDVRVLDTSFVLAFMAVFRSAVTILAADGILWYFTGIAGTSIILIVLYVVKEFMSLGFLVGLLQLSFRAESANLNFISEALDGSATIRAFGQKQIDRFRAEHGMLSDELMKGKYHCEAYNRFVLIRCDRVLGVHMLLLMFLLSMHDVSPAELGLMLYYVFTINSDVYTLRTKLLDVALCLLNVERVRRYSLIEPEVQSYVGNPLVIPSSWPHRGSVVFDHVSFSYANAEKSDEKPALALYDVSFTVHGGEKIGVVGRTGSGKSSLAMALFRVHPLARGRILIDDLDVSLLDLSALRRNVCIIPQSPLFYRCSVRNYLDPFNEFGDVALLDALRRCGLRGSMANLEAELADNGENWSLGERQMLCLARVVLRPSRILVLDESFSAVDQASQATLLSVLDTAFSDSTVFLITHRLDDVLQFDKILVMQEGRAVEFGAAEELAADPDSAFYEFLETTLLSY
ncbi:hypothetical protein BBI17_003141 [Phytophthora kernoviae]|uniref:Uncharacterized protein n=2 Tax=Phytophthora kernoviae TaxID=325452 RepID=A0A3R7J3T1_9STRA|nr:hypothetical protein G195_003429 [Phytophthora kernoviae 00238/432]KAG2528473.1 hypothetical protein JM16_002794 [Phytophthora kernoviae]RLM95349.1 hypothetical protein BBI17_003141 [Phytophthora kernoviae]